MKVLVNFIALMSIASCSIFSSNHHLKTLMHLEWNMIYYLREYVQQTEDRVTNIKRYLEDFNNSYDDIHLQNVPFTPLEAMDNPLQAYHMIKRFNTHWNILKESLHEHSYQILEFLESYDYYVPKDNDVLGSALALVRLQETYSLNIDEMSIGNIKGIKSGIGLSVQDMLYLGKVSLDVGLYALGMRWIQKAMDHGRSKETEAVNKILYYIQMQNETFDTLYDLTRNKELSTGHPHDKSSEEEVKSAQQNEIYKLGSGNTDEEEERTMKALCRGESLRTPKVESLLHCSLHSRGNPYLILQPLKMEEINLDPYIVVFHHVFSDEQLESMKQVATPKLHASAVYDGSGKSLASFHRGSQNAWMRPTDHPVIQSLYLYVQAATGLLTDATRGYAELVQVTNYGIGGHYSLHVDFVRPIGDDSPVRDLPIDCGDRIATFVLYLSDVTSGGATVFPFIGVSIFPEKGSAVFWYNLYKNGTGNVYTRHAGCPVLHGNKWIANLWMREKDQIFRRPCGLDRKS